MRACISVFLSVYLTVCTCNVQTSLDGLPAQNDTWRMCVLVIFSVVFFRGFYNLLTCLPQYMKNVLDYDITTLGFLSSLPYVCSFLFSISVGQLADFARSRGVATITVRRWCQCGGNVVSAASIIGVSYVTGPHAHAIAIALLCLSLAGTGMNQSGFMVNHLDIAPQYAGILMGISNTFGTIPGFVAPQVTDMLTTADPHTQKDLLKQQWQTVFQITAGVYAFGILVFGFLADGEVQSWAGGPSKSFNSRLILTPDLTF